MKKDTLIKILAVIMALTIVITLASCSAKNGGPEVIEVTDENGEVVTDANGDPVTELVDFEDDSTSASGEAVTAEKQTEGGTTTAGGNGGDGKTTTTAAGGNEDKTTEKTTEKTTQETTTEKPKKRDVSVTIRMPNKNKADSKLTIMYRVAGESEYTRLDPIDVKLDGNEQTFDVDSIKGTVKVVIRLSGCDIYKDNNNDTSAVVIKSNENHGYIEPVIGIENIDGGWD